MKRAQASIGAKALAFLCAQHEKHFGRPPNLVDPTSWNGILFKMMVSGESMRPLRQFVSDKEHLKQYVAAVIGDAYNVRTQDFDRLAGHQAGHKRAFYSIDWVRLPCEDKEETAGGDLPRPRRLEEMAEVARRLSRAFNFIRVDLYSVADGVRVGELTNFPGGCYEPFRPQAVDEKLGRLFSEPDLDVVRLLA